MGPSGSATLLSEEFNSRLLCVRLAEILYRMDQTLEEASKCLEPFLLAHFRAQLFLHTAVLIFKRCTKVIQGLGFLLSIV